MDDYFAVDALSRSDLKGIVNNVEEWYGRKVGTLPPIQQTKDMAFGSALDFYLCNGKGPDPLPKGAVMVPDEVLAKNKARSTDAYRDWLKTLPPGTPTVTSKEAEKLLAESDEQIAAFMACEEQLRSHSEAAELMFDQTALHQHVLRFTCPETGAELRSLPDIIIPGEAIVDLKTMADVSPMSFLRSCDRFWYDCQAAMAQFGWCDTCGDSVPVYFVCVRNAPPYDVAVYRAGESIMSAGWDRTQAAIRKYQRCSASGNWRNDTHNVVIDLEAPTSWQYRDVFTYESEV